jgi:hypothetical protein
MKRMIAAVSFGLLASSALAQSFDRSPTDPTMPAYAYDPSAPYGRAEERYASSEDRRQVAASGATRSDLEISTEAQAAGEEQAVGEALDERHLERQEGYFDPSN